MKKNKEDALIGKALEKIRMGQNDMIRIDQRLYDDELKCNVFRNVESACQ